MSEKRCAFIVFDEALMSGIKMEFGIKRKYVDPMKQDSFANSFSGVGWMGTHIIDATRYALQSALYEFELPPLVWYERYWLAVKRAFYLAWDEIKRDAKELLDDNALRYRETE